MSMSRKSGVLRGSISSDQWTILGYLWVQLVEVSENSGLFRVQLRKVVQILGYFGVQLVEIVDFKVFHLN